MGNISADNIAANTLTADHIRGGTITTAISDNVKGMNGVTMNAAGQIMSGKS